MTDTILLSPSSFFLCFLTAINLISLRSHPLIPVKNVSSSLFLPLRSIFFSLFLSPYLVNNFLNSRLESVSSNFFNFSAAFSFFLFNSVRLHRSQIALVPPSLHFSFSFPSIRFLTTGCRQLFSLLLQGNLSCWIKRHGWKDLHLCLQLDSIIWVSFQSETCISIQCYFLYIYIYILFIFFFH